jgi:molybdopterin synthase catalytic subunit
MIDVTEKSLDPCVVSESLEITAGTGSVVVHFAVVKPVADDRPTEGIRFTPTQSTVAEMETLEAELRSAWNVNDIWLMRRIGELKTGEVISVVAVAAAGREDAFGAAQDAIKGFKRMVSMEKTELFKE